MRKVICLSRQDGSGGHAVAEKLSQKLGIPYYDKEILEEILHNTDLPVEALTKAAKQAFNPFFHEVFYEGENKEYYGMNATEILMKMQQKIITEKAHESDCIFIGRCADVILRDCDDIKQIDVFVTAPVDKRVARMVEKDNLDLKNAVKAVALSDKKRKVFYKYLYKGAKEWGNPADYDLVVNVDRLGEDGCVELIAGLFEKL